jgi:putative acyl-CoA dehydrogenase
MREPDHVALLLSDLDDMSGGCPIVADEPLHLSLLLRLAPDVLEASARLLAQHLVLIAQACLLRRHSTPEIAEAFVRTRLNDRRAGRVVGAIDLVSVQARPILSRAFTD